MMDFAQKAYVTGVTLCEKVDFEQIVTEATEDAWKKLFLPENAWQNLYLVYTPSTKTEYGTVFVYVSYTGLFDGVKRVSMEHIPQNLEKHQLRRWIWERCRNLPILPFGKGS